MTEEKKTETTDTAENIDFDELTTQAVEEKKQSDAEEASKKDKPKEKWNEGWKPKWLVIGGIAAVAIVAFFLWFCYVL